MAEQVHFKFDESPGSTTVADATGNGNTGTMVNGASLTESAVVDDALGNCLYLRSGDYVTVAGGNITGTAITIALWARVFSNPNAGVWFIRRGNASNNQYMFGFNNFPAMCFFPQGGTANGPFRAPTGSWEHYAVVWNGTAARFFANGVFLSSVAVSATMSSPSGAVTNIGTTLPAGSAPTTELQMDALHIYDTALADADITALYDAEKPSYEALMLPAMLGGSVESDRVVTDIASPSMWRTDLTYTPPARPTKGQLWPRGDY